MRRSANPIRAGAAAGSASAADETQREPDPRRR
jgi:hypothetical protein